MNQDERRQLDTKLVAMGWGGVDSPDLAESFAKVIEEFPGDKHWFFRGMLNECEPEKRREMYYSLRPKFVNFKPLELETYLAQINDDAYRMVSQGMMRVEGRPPDAIVIEGEGYVAADPSRATHVAVRLVCRKCNRMKVFVADTMMGAMIKARKKGWVRDYSNSDREICPKCPAVREQKVAHA